MLRRSWIAAVLLMASGAAPGSVIVLGNYKTGALVIEGNAGGAEAERAVALAQGGSKAGWTQIFGPDDDARGWGTVLCVRHKDGFFFAEAIGEVSEAEANRTVNMKANRFLARLVGGDDAALIERSGTWPDLARQAIAAGIGEKVECAQAWNNQGQQISYAGRPLNVADAPKTAAAPVVAETKPVPQDAVQEATPTKLASATAALPKRDFEAEYQAKLREWEQQQAEHRRKVEEHDEAERQFEAKKMAQREQTQAVLAQYQQQLAQHTAAEAAYAEKWLRSTPATQQQPVSSTGIADAFKLQNDAEWKRVSQGLRQPSVFPGAQWAYCYQPSLVDSTLYETQLFTTGKQKTELELGFADEVAKETRIGSAMSTYCYVTPDLSWLDDLRNNVHRVHADLRLKEPALPAPR